MSNTLIKVGAGIIGLSSVTTGSYFIRGYYNAERISHRIGSSGMTLLTSSDSETEGAKRGKEYVEDTTNVNIGNLTDFDQKKGNKDQVPQSFKNKCLYSVSTAIEGNESLLSQIEKYCTKSFKLAELLKDEKKIKLIEQSDDAGWKVIGGKYFDEKTKNKRNPLDIKSSVYRDRLPQEYKDNCRTKSDKQIRSKRDMDYSIVKEWCTKEA